MTSGTQPPQAEPGDPRNPETDGRAPSAAAPHPGAADQAPPQHDPQAPADSSTVPSGQDLAPLRTPRPGRPVRGAAGRPQFAAPQPQSAPAAPAGQSAWWHPAAASDPWRDPASHAVIQTQAGPPTRPAPEPLPARQQRPRAGPDSALVIVVSADHRAHRRHPRRGHRHLGHPLRRRRLRWFHSAPNRRPNATSNRSPASSSRSCRRSSPSSPPTAGTARASSSPTTAMS